MCFKITLPKTWTMKSVNVRLKIVIDGTLIVNKVKRMGVRLKNSNLWNQTDEERGRKLEFLKPKLWEASKCGWKSFKAKDLQNTQHHLRNFLSDHKLRKFFKHCRAFIESKMQANCNNGGEQFHWACYIYICIRTIVTFDVFTVNNCRFMVLII